MNKRFASALVALSLFAFLSFGLLMTGPGAGRATASHAGGMDAMSLDMDPTGNTPSGLPTGHTETIGTTENCARINENDLLDADEDMVADSLTIDVTATNIPASSPSQGYAYTLLYNEASLTVESQDPNFILRAHAASSGIFNASDATPDADNNGYWSVATLDVNSSATESGSGVIDRLGVSSEAAASGVYNLDLTDGYHIDPANDAALADVLGDALVAVNVPCPSAIEQADVAVTGVSMSAPPSGSPGVAFPVTASATVHNNGPFGPVNADVSFVLSVPPDCSATPARLLGIQDVSLPTSTATILPAVPASWSVTCSETSNHSFSVSTTVLLDHPGAVDPAPENNTGSAQAITVLGAEADVKVTAVSVPLPATETVGTAFEIIPTATLHNNGPFGPVSVDAVFTLLPAPADCFVLPLSGPQTVAAIVLPASTAVQVSPSLPWLVTCDQPGTHSFSVAAAISLNALHLADPTSGNESGSASASINLLVGACGADPAPAGDPLQNMSPLLITLIQQLTATGTPVPEAQRTPLACDFDISVSDNKGAPIDDCEVSLPTEPHPCSVTLSYSIDEPGGATLYQPSVRLLPVGVIFVSPNFDFAGDLEISNGTAVGTASFDIRTDGGLTPFGIPCVVDAVFPGATAVEGGIRGNVPESNDSDDLDNPNVWPNDLNGEVATVQAELNPYPVPPPPLPPLPPTTTLVSRNIVNLAGLVSLTLNVLTFTIDDPLLQSATGAKWVVIGLPGDAINPDPAGTIGGNPDADDPVSIPLVTCAPHGLSLTFNGTAGAATYAACTAPGSQFAWSLMDPDALNFTGDDGPRSDVSPCSLDVDGDDLTSAEETYYGTSDTNADTDGDGVPDGADNCKLVPNLNQVDYDGDGLGDICDGDVDGDTVPNATDLCPNTAVGAEVDANGCSLAQVDADGDGVCNPGAVSGGPPPGCTGIDNCPLVANTDQANLDGDALGDACDLDDDGDGVDDLAEASCGGDAVNPSIRPERVDGPFAGVSEDGDVLIDEPLPAGTGAFDCDGDGYRGLVEDHVFNLVGGRDQDACGADGWPAELASLGAGANKIILTDLTSFIAPVRVLGTSPGDPDYSVRWDLVPGTPNPALDDIAINDIADLILTRPPMLGGVREFGGPVCPWPP